jgi:hypothetical protein
MLTPEPCRKRLLLLSKWLAAAQAFSAVALRRGDQSLAHKAKMDCDKAHRACRSTWRNTAAPSRRAPLLRQVGGARNSSFSALSRRQRRWRAEKPVECSKDGEQQGLGDSPPRPSYYYFPKYSPNPFPVRPWGAESPAGLTVFLIGSGETSCGSLPVPLE